MKKLLLLLTLAASFVGGWQWDQASAADDAGNGGGCNGYITSWQSGNVTYYQRYVWSSDCRSLNVAETWSIGG
jgi:hypothetical protein